jgi:hypothetical protein
MGGICNTFANSRREMHFKNTGQLLSTAKKGLGKPLENDQRLLDTLLNGQSHFTLDRIGGADANMSYNIIFNSVFYIEWDVHSHKRILYLVLKDNLDRD